MKNSNLIKALEKSDLSVERSGEYKHFFCYSKNRHAIAEWYDQEGEAICLKVRYVNDKDDSMTDYSAGSFYDTIKGTVSALERMDNQSEEEKNKEKAISLDFIEIERTEGPTELCKKNRFNSLKEAHEYLEKSIPSCPRLGYDKFKVSIVFKDGLTHATRMDLHHFTNKYFSPADCNLIMELDRDAKFLREEATKSRDLGNKPDLSLVIHYNEIINRLNREN